VFERYNIVSGGDLRDTARWLDGNGSSALLSLQGEEVCEEAMDHRANERGMGQLVLAVEPEAQRGDDGQ
jgi:hypothetical protein